MSVQAPAPGFRAHRGLVRFQLASGQVLTRIRKEAESPPYGATMWFDGRSWRDDFGGQWLERGNGKLEWEWAR